MEVTIGFGMAMSHVVAPVVEAAEQTLRDPSTSEGMVLLTSRVSVEMVQKTAAIGAPVMVAVSAPTVSKSSPIPIE